MSAIDFGRPSTAEGTCGHCRLGRRPLWTRAVLRCCSCWANAAAAAGRDCTFASAGWPT